MGMRTIIIIASVILATSAFPQYAPARKEGSYEPASHSSPEKAERATRDKVKATRDPNYIPKKAPATKDSNYIKEAKRAKRDTNYVPQIAPAQREGSNEPVSHSPPKNAVRATRDPNYVPKRVLATRDPNYVPKGVLATRDPNYVPKIAPAQREGSNGPASHSPPKNAVKATRDPNYVPKNAPATRDPNYIEKAKPSCDCSKIRQEVQAVPINTANLAPAQQEGKPSAPVKPLKNVVSATRDPNYCNCSNTEEVIEVFE